MPRLCCHFASARQRADTPAFETTILKKLAGCRLAVHWPARVCMPEAASSSTPPGLESPSWRTSACSKSIRLRMSRNFPNSQFINSGLNWGNGYASELATWEVGEQTQTYRQRTGDGGMFAWPLGSEVYRHEHPFAPCLGSVSLFGPLSRAVSVEKPIRLRFIRGTPSSQFVRSRLTGANGSSIEPVIWEEENKRRRIGFGCNRWSRCTICVSPCSVPFGKSCCH